MAKAEKSLVNDGGPNSESLVSSFHRVEKLVPEGQQLLTIPPELPVKEALKIMEKNHYSQLPVVAGNAVLGVFSHRSFADKALARQKSGKDWLGDLTVEDFLEEFEYALPTVDWNRVLRYLNQDDAFLVGHQDGLDGLVTTMDVLYYFQEIANPFIMLAEIELSLRKIIRACMEGEDLPEVFKKSLRSSYERGRVPDTLRSMMFNDYINIITSRDNWSDFKIFFGERDGVRNQTNRKLDLIREWRNTVFHFRERLSDWDLNTLSEYRDWLHRRVRAYESRQQKWKSTVRKKKKGKMTREEFLSRCSPVAASFFNYVLDRSQRAGHLINWGEKRFSVRAYLPDKDRYATFAYCKPPEAFSFYHFYVPISEEEINGVRKDLLATGHFQLSGDHSLKTFVTDENLTGLRDAYDYILSKMATIV